ncbi:MAG: sialate O-acetylesterase [Sphingorhabdus sp.]
MPITLVVVLSASVLAASPAASADKKAAPSIDAASEKKNADAPKFAKIFTDHMILQRGKPMAIWGTAPEGAQVEVSFNGKTLSTIAEETGIGTNKASVWKVEFPAKAEGGPYDIKVSSAGAGSQTIKDILIGDVFLCSGQSNMEMKVNRVRSAPAEINRKHSPTIRQFHPRYKISPFPLREFAENTGWVVASKKTVPDFSANCYFFAKQLQRHSQTPLGLINSSWGGSQIEAWIDQKNLRGVEGHGESLDILNLYAKDAAAGIAALGAQWERWYKNGSGGKTPWLERPAKGTGWTPVPGFTSWKSYGADNVKRHDGLVWYRNKFKLTKKQARKPAKIALGKLAKGDIVWVNGHFVGRSTGWEPRHYDLPAKLLKPGVNLVLVNVRSMWGSGGMLGPAETIGLTPKGGEMVSMAKGWEYKREPTPGLRMTPLIPWGTTAGYTGMHNAMIAPLTGLQIKGAVWYQGESNTRRADQYDEMLAALIKNWRVMFGADLPVVIVQLPEFGAPPTKPTESTWANLREAQRKAAMSDPNVGLVVTLGLGDPTDIHPTKKQEVGIRTAGVYRGLVGESDADALGFAPKRAYRSGEKTLIELTAAEGGFVTRSADHPIAFELCQSAPDTAMSCAYASAALVGNVVTLTSSKIGNPTHVRYCWGASPTCNLHSKDGLPVGPFQMAIE